MRINTRTQAIDMQQIDNRRFMFSPKTGVLVLGRQYKKTSLVNASHAVELADAGITKGFDDFVRGLDRARRGLSQRSDPLCPVRGFQQNIPFLTVLLTRWKCSGKTARWPERWYGASGAGGTALICDPYGFTERGTKSPSGSS